MEEVARERRHHIRPSPGRICSLYDSEKEVVDGKSTGKKNLPGVRKRRGDLRIWNNQPA